VVNIVFHNNIADIEIPIFQISYLLVPNNQRNAFSVRLQLYHRIALLETSEL